MPSGGQRIAEYVLEIEVAGRAGERTYLASHRLLLRRARVAVEHAATVGAPAAELPLMREARMLDLLHHAGAPRVYECGLAEGRAWAACEQIEGLTLERAVAERPLPVAQIIAVLRDAAAVLAHAHARGVVHRSLMPRSLLLTPDRASSVCLVGWGDAVATGTARASLAELDARFYRPPELAGDAVADPSVDIYALGAVMFEAATCTLPSPLQRFPGIPGALYALFSSMLSRPPADRPSAQAVAAEAVRLAELYLDGDRVEEVDVELIDISRAAPAVASLGWSPPTRMPALPRSAAGELRRRRTR